MIWSSRGSVRAPHRVLLFLLLFVGLMILASTIVPSSERLAKLLPRSIAALSGGISALKMLLCGLFATLVMIKTIDKRPFAAVGLARHPGFIADTARGLLLGALLMSIPPLLLLALGHARLEGPSGALAQLLYAVPLFALATFVIAVNEEFLFRGYLFQLLVEGLGAVGAALLVSALFGFLHYMNPNGTWAGALGTALYGGLLSYAYVKTRSLWFPIGIHWSANFVEGVAWGLPTSGHVYGATLLQTRLTGPALFTGGAFGPEAGIWTPLAVLAGFLLTCWWSSLKPSDPMRGHWDRYIRPERSSRAPT